MGGGVNESDLSARGQAWRPHRAVAEAEPELKPTLLVVYPPTDDEDRCEALRTFCFPDAFRGALHDGPLPAAPECQEFVFAMTEGIATPTRLYGACIQTQELCCAYKGAAYLTPRCACWAGRMPRYDSLCPSLEEDGTSMAHCDPLWPAVARSCHGQVLLPAEQGVRCIFVLV